MQKAFWLLSTALVFLFFMLTAPSRSAGFNGQAATSTTVAESTLLEIGPPPKTPFIPQSAAELKIVSYNIRWRGGDELRQLTRLLKEDGEVGGATILGLQEVDRNKKRTRNENTARFIAQALGMYYAWAAPPTPVGEKEEETGVVILSAHPLSDVQRLVLPRPGPGGRRRVALGATVTLGRTRLRVYSLHTETRIPVACKLDQLRAVLDDLARHPRNMPAVILGDLNTWEPEAISKTFKLFGAEDFQTPFDAAPTFFRRAWFIPLELKLDWIWLRRLEANRYGINRAVKFSDHWPLWVVAKTPDAGRP